MFRLMEQFASGRHPIAPVLYKTLTFILVEFYWEIDMRDMMLRHFIFLFKKLENIPVAILCEPLLKQVQISQYHTTNFNVFDFEFFQCVAYHKKLNVQTCVLLMEALTKIALASVFYAKVSILTLKTVIMRFSKSPEILSHWKDSFREIITSLINIETSITQHNLLKKEPKQSMFERLATNTKNRRKLPHITGLDVQPEMRLTKAELIAVRTNQKLIVNLLEKIILLGNDLLNEELRGQLIDAYLVIQQQLRHESKPIKYLLGKYGYDVEAMISQRVGTSAPLAANESADGSNPPLEPMILGEPGQHKDYNLTPRGVSEPPQGSKRPRGASGVASPSKNRLTQIEVVRQSYDPGSMQRRALHQNQGGEVYADDGKQPRNKSEVPGYPYNRGPSPRQSPYNISHLLNQRDDSIALYDHAQHESKTDLLRYRQACKKYAKLFKEMFHRYAGNTTRSRQQPIKTFDLVGTQSMIISGINLGKLVKDFDLCVNNKIGRTLKEVQSEIPTLIKLINEQVMGLKKSKVAELSYEGFVEYLVQHAHQYYNVHTNYLEKKEN